jgi:hypothetical protein
MQCFAQIVQIKKGADNARQFAEFVQQLPDFANMHCV